MNRKVSDCISVRINVGNYQHIELTKYAEETIEFSSEKERIEQEDNLRNDLIESLKRSMKAIPEALGKGIQSAIEVEEAIQAKIPEWLEQNPVPNIANANKAQTQVLRSAAEQQNAKDAVVEVDGLDAIDEAPVSDSEVTKAKSEIVSASEPETPSEPVSELEKGDDVEDLFVKDENDLNEESQLEVEAPAEAEKEQEKVEVTAIEKPAKEEKKVAVDSDGFDVFDDEDDDLFGDS